MILIVPDYNSQLPVILNKKISCHEKRNILDVCYNSVIMDKASYVGTIDLDLLKLPPNVAPWEPYETEDLFALGVVTIPQHYLLTTGSGIFFSPTHTVSSLATTPSYQLPTTSQFYIAGRDVIRWGGELDPYEIDYDHYVFTPDFNRGKAIVSKAPKSEFHHFSQMTEKMDDLSEGWKEIFEAIRQGKFP